MRNLMVFAASGLAAVATSVTLVAAANAATGPPDETGKKFSDAKADLTKAGFETVVSTSVGDAVGQGDCIVVGQQSVMPTAFVGGGWKGPSSKPKVRLSLDCNPKKS